MSDFIQIESPSSFNTINRLNPGKDVDSVQYKLPNERDTEAVLLIKQFFFQT